MKTKLFLVSSLNLLGTSFEISNNSTSDKPSVFKLPELLGLYRERLEQFGKDKPNVNQTRLKNFGRDTRTDSPPEKASHSIDI